MMTMNRVAITRETIDLLKNFAGINSNILIEPGNKIKTISNYKNVMAEATVSETFEQQFGIWDLISRQVCDHPWIECFGDLLLFRSQVAHDDQQGHQDARVGSLNDIHGQ